MTDAAHSILPPSGAAAWSKCAAWLTHNAGGITVDTPKSQEGVAAHWLVAEMLAGVIPDPDLVAPNGVPITDDMIAGADLMVDTIRTMAPATQVKAWHIEEHLECRAIHDECFGTPDFWSVNASTKTIDVIDYKFGHGFVDHVGNLQCIAYASGILDKLADATGRGVGQIDREYQVRITIVQPRCYAAGGPVRTWQCIASDLRPEVNKLAMAAEAALRDRSTAIVGPQCDHCAGRHVCQALQIAAYRAAELGYSSAPADLPSVAASTELMLLQQAADRLADRISGLEEQVMQQARRGQVTPWHAIATTQGREQWSVTPDEVVTLGKIFKVELSRPGVLTPNQARKLGIDGTVINGYIKPRTSGFKLIQDTGAQAARIFKKA